MGNAGVKFGQGRCYSKLTSPVCGMAGNAPLWALQGYKFQKDVAILLWATRRTMMLPFKVASPLCGQRRGKISKRILPFQVDSACCGQCTGKIYRKLPLQFGSTVCTQCRGTIRRVWPFQVGYPFVGNAGVKFREGCCHSTLT